MQNNECIYICEQYTDYNENTLSSEIRARVDAHLTICSLCRNTYQELNHVLNKLHNLPTMTTKSDFTTSLLSKVEAFNHENTWQKMYKSSYTRVAGYAIAAGFIFALGLNIWIDPISPVNPGRSQEFAEEKVQIQPDPSLTAQMDSSEDSRSDSITFQHTTINPGTQSLQLVSDSK